MDKRLSEILATLFSKAENQILGAKKPLLGKLLPYLEQRVTKVYNTANEKYAHSLATRSGEMLINKFASMPLHAGMIVLESKILFDQIFILDNKVRELGLRFLQSADDKEKKNYQKMAKDLEEEFQSIKNHLIDDSMSWQQQYARLFSEISLDLNYIIGTSNQLSFRMGKVSGQFVPRT